MLSFVKLSQPWMKPIRSTCMLFLRSPTRHYNEHSNKSEDDDGERPTKISAAAQLAQTVESDTKLESPEPVQRMVELENVRSRINELDQRKLRHQEYAQMLKQLIIKPSNYTQEPKLPFKQPLPANNMRHSLRNCSSIEEVLLLTSDPYQLANELVRLSWELNTEKRKNDVVLEGYLELKQEILKSKLKPN
ncbi:uncharacterized protein LOC115482968 [Drosophila hydei]|uniref:Uncharacterized protein LOC115482968 n=1 Tax=Drosophila hydei TaxID=7224 RepID=A0A6J2SSZ7_DROHY|nr:uncharacterized protein LOC115482968 [Drosophila hydei]